MKKANNPEHKAYLDSKVTPVLEKMITELIIHKPNDSVRNVSHF